MNETANNHIQPQTLAPKAENYVPAPKFKYAPNQREIDFAQIVAAGGDMVEALSIASLITQKEKESATRAQLYGMGTRLLSNPAVQERIDYYLLLHRAGMDISAARIQQELAAVSFADFAQAFHKKDGPVVSKKNPHYDSNNPDSKEFEDQYEWRAGDPITNPHHLPRHLRAAIKEWKIDKDGIVCIKYHDKLKAAHTLGEMEGHFDAANRAKAPQVNISIGDGKGREMKNVTPEAHRDTSLDVGPPYEFDCLK